MNTNSIRSSIHIRRINQSDIPAVSMLHARMLRTTTARIGSTYLSLIYNQLLHDTTLHTILVAHKGPNIIGVITATNNMHKTQKQLQTILIHPYALWNIYIALVHRKITILELFTRTINDWRIRSEFTAPYATILTFFVDTPHQHCGIGTRLMQKLQKKLPKEKLYVDTELFNTPAQQWYISHRFHPVKTIGNRIIFFTKSLY